MTAAHFDDNGADHQGEDRSWASALQNDEADESFRLKTKVVGWCLFGFVLFAAGAVVVWGVGE